MTTTNESFESRLWRWGANLFPAYRRSGGKVTFVAANFQEVHVSIKNTWRTKNHLGLTWGGSIYAAVDPIFGVMLHKLLGNQWYVVDSQATIHFLKGLKTHANAQFVITNHELLKIKQSLAQSNKAEHEFIVNIIANGQVHVKCTKKVAIRPKRVHSDEPSK
ncbi:hypothetical protein PA25_24870 [Pseudoalteromonas sp. A25]|uniref:PaaI family thioesterase n=1 Tax=Pseudoalteromonas sp. A25 TaxID=116092 RepID=UPI001260D8C0|nr:DUF4442 domain-containing protein [Pseudoalteromonas sp. A25]BBN82502.1 hypothetical protein PA25_24870 [Pseudoalteromonas sp. A25]